MKMKPKKLVTVEVCCDLPIDVTTLPEKTTEVCFNGEIVPGATGATFTPAVSSEGIISWTNDRDLPNPEPISIKGPQGNPTTVNGKTGESITLTAEDVGALTSADFDLIDCGTSSEVI